jgi:hypothetical protein
MVVSRHEHMKCDEERRNGALIAPAHPLNGVDFIEYRRDDLAPPVSGEGLPEFSAFHARSRAVE